MAQHLNILSAISVLLCMLNAHAENISDPTKPPMSMLGSTPQELIVDSNVLMLQSITLGSQIKSAMINGETVLLGQRYHDWRLIHLSSNQAVLKNARGETKRLDILYPIQKMRVTQQETYVANHLQKIKSEHNHD